MGNNFNCPKCGSSLRAGVRFCGVCGAQLSIQPAQPVQTASKASFPKPVAPVPFEPSLLCTRCGKPVRAMSRFCTACGQLVNAHPLQPPPVQNQQSIPPAQKQQNKSAQPASKRYLALHGTLVSILLLCIFSALGGAFAQDVLAVPVPTSTPPIITPVPVVSMPPTANPSQRVVLIGLLGDGRFGLMTTGDTQISADVRNKKLTFSENGETSNTRIWVDGETPIFGADGGISRSGIKPDGSGSQLWEHKKIQITQTLDYVLGADGLGNTIRIEYQLLNNDTRAHRVGLRIMIDTLIGDNDGVPFVVPGLSGITEKAVDLKGDQVPDAIRALEVANLANPSVIVSLTLKGADATHPDRVLITGWLGSDMEWDFLGPAGGVGSPLVRGGLLGMLVKTPDSAVGLFFDPQELLPGQTRTIVTYYGLGSISSTASGNTKLGLLGPNSIQEGQTFYVSAAVAQPQAGETVEIVLPSNLRLEPGETAVKTVEPGSAGYTQISWLVRACQSAASTSIQVNLEPANQTETWPLNVQPLGLTRPGGVCP